MRIGPSLALPAVRRVGFVAPNPSIGASYTASEHSLGAGGVATYLFKGIVTTTATGTLQALVVVDNGATTNRYLLAAAASTTQAQLTRTTASTPSTQNLGALSSGVEFRIGMAVDASGGAVASLNGAATLSVSGGPTSGLTTLRIGQASGGASTLGGSVALVRVFPGVALSAAELQTVVAAI